MKNCFPVAGATPEQLAAFCASMMQSVNEGLKRPLVWYDLAKLTRVMKNMRTLMPDQDALVKRIKTITQQWPSIEQVLSWKTSLRLDEFTLFDRNVTAIAEKIERGDEVVPSRQAGRDDDVYDTSPDDDEIDYDD